MPTAKAVPLGYSEGGSALIFAKAKTSDNFVGTFSWVAVGDCSGRGYDLISSDVALPPPCKDKEMETFLKELRTKVWRTAGARYDAARRLKRRELFSTISLAFFSALTVALAFLQRIYSAQSGTQLDNYLTALSVCLGVFILAISLMEWGAGNGAKSDALHRNAEDLNSLQLLIWQRISEVTTESKRDWGEVDSLRVEYERIKERCTTNHAPIDDKMFLARNRMAVEFLGVDGKPKIGRAEYFWITFWHSISSIWYFGFFWILIFCVLLNTPWPAQK